MQNKQGLILNPREGGKKGGWERARDERGERKETEVMYVAEEKVTMNTSE